MRSAKELMGKPIYSVTNGRQVGSVKDLFVDSDLHKITGIYTGSEGLFNRRAKLIPFDKVTVLGIDAVLVVDSNVIKEDREYAPSQEWLRRDNVQGRVMHTAGGTKVGSVGDLLLDDDSKVVAFTLSRVYVEGPITKNRIVSRTAVLDAGGLDGNMIIDLTEVEQSNIGAVGTPEPVDFEPRQQPATEDESSDKDAESEASSDYDAEGDEISGLEGEDIAPE
jgi:uncharacterized protein YrrD